MVSLKSHLHWPYYNSHSHVDYSVLLIYAFHCLCKCRLCNLHIKIVIMWLWWTQDFVHISVSIRHSTSNAFILQKLYIHVWLKLHCLLNYIFYAKNSILCYSHSNSFAVVSLCSLAQTMPPQVFRQNFDKIFLENCFKFVFIVE